MQASRQAPVPGPALTGDGGVLGGLPLLLHEAGQPHAEGLVALLLRALELRHRPQRAHEAALHLPLPLQLLQGLAHLVRVAPARRGMASAGMGVQDESLDAGWERMETTPLPEARLRGRERYDGLPAPHLRVVVLGVAVRPRRAHRVPDRERPRHAPGGRGAQRARPLHSTYTTPGPGRSSTPCALRPHGVVT